MSVSYTSASGLLGQAETTFQGTKTAGNSSLGKNDFLNLLVTQLKQQDPLNPQDDKEFVAQLATFSNLEQLTNINAGIDKLNASTAQQQMFTAVGFIGKEVMADGNSLAKIGDSVSTLYYNLPETAAKVSINIMDKNGNIVRSVDQGAKAAGDQTFEWDGKDWYGNAVADGVYQVGITTAKADGTSMLVSTKVTGIVSGVASDSNGGYVLTTQDGRSLSMTDVKGVITPKTTS